jgi:hypothetical protein
VVSSTIMACRRERLPTTQVSNGSGNCVTVLKHVGTKRTVPIGKMMVYPHGKKIFARGAHEAHLPVYFSNAEEYVAERHFCCICWGFPVVLSRIGCRIVAALPCLDSVYDPKRTS